LGKDKKERIEVFHTGRPGTRGRKGRGGERKGGSAQSQCKFAAIVARLKRLEAREGSQGGRYCAYTREEPERACTRDGVGVGHEKPDRDNTEGFFTQPWARCTASSPGGGTIGSGGWKEEGDNSSLLEKQEARKGFTVGVPM